MLNVRSGEPEFRIRIPGEQCWWRVQNLPTEGKAGCETANEHDALSLCPQTRVLPELLRSVTKQATHQTCTSPNRRRCQPHTAQTWEQGPVRGFPGHEVLRAYTRLHPRRPTFLDSQPWLCSGAVSGAAPPSCT